MKTPNIIYLQACGDCDFHECLPEQCAECDFNALGDVTWCEDRINKTDKVDFSEDYVREILSSFYIPYLLDIRMEQIKNEKSNEQKA